jgi:hypothetical protein
LPAGWKEAQPNDGALRGKWWTVYNDSRLNGTPQFEAAAGFCKIIKSVANDSVSWKPKEPARATTGIPIGAVIVRDEDGLGRWVDYRPKQHFKLFQAAV